MRIVTTVLYFGTFILACIGTPSDSYQPRALTKPIEEHAEITGSLMIVSDGIMVLLREEQNYIKSTILIASNDSVKSIAECSYETRIENGCRIGMDPWISIGGHYLRKDSNQPIFQYSQVKILDDGSTCSLISEE